MSDHDFDEIPQAGRPFVITDPGLSITYGDIYTAVQTLSNHSFRVQLLPPVVPLILSYVIEWYRLLPYLVPILKKYIPEMTGNAKHLQPAIFSICTHLIASDADARKPVAEGGLGYESVINTMDGIVGEILDWNKEHEGDGTSQVSESGVAERTRKIYTSSMMLADQLKQLGQRAADAALEVSGTQQIS
jgi:hypothetical protein